MSEVGIEVPQKTQIDIIAEEASNYFRSRKNDPDKDIVDMYSAALEVIMDKRADTLTLFQQVAVRLAKEDPTQLNRVFELAGPQEKGTTAEDWTLNLSAIGIGEIAMSQNPGLKEENNRRVNT